MSVVDEITVYLKKEGLKFQKRKGTLTIFYPDLEIQLVLKIDESSRKAVLSLDYDEELRDHIADLFDSGEDVEDIIDTAISEIRDIAVNISNILESKGYSIEDKISEGEKDIRDLMEEVLEEYEEYSELE